MDNKHDPTLQYAQRNEPVFAVIETIIGEGDARAGEEKLGILKIQAVFFEVLPALVIVPFIHSLMSLFVTAIVVTIHIQIKKKTTGIYHENFWIMEQL
jgi:hypothetical protein